MFNILRSLDEVDQSRAILLMVGEVVSLTDFKKIFPNIGLVQVAIEPHQSLCSEFIQHPPASAYSNTPFHWLSSCAYRSLAELDRIRKIDYVEFSDGGGLAFCTLQEKRLQGFLDGAIIAVRLNMSVAAVMAAEASPVTIANLNVVDLERKCLRDCDCVVAPSTAIAETTRKIFDFLECDWFPRLVLHHPRYFSYYLTPKEYAISASPDQFIIFPSEPRRYNRPDVFLRGVVNFISTNSFYRGTVVVRTDMAETAVDAGIDAVVPQIPIELNDRIRSMPMTAMHEWERNVEGAVVVFCGVSTMQEPFAVEASYLGARLILNRKNPAFDDNSRWLDGINCLKFDGTVTGLSLALARNFDDEHLIPIQQPTQVWPWIASPRSRAWSQVDEWPMVSIVVPNYNLGTYLLETLSCLLGQAYQNIEILIIDDASTDLSSIQIIDGLVRQSDPRVKIIKLNVNVGLAAARNIGVGHSSGKYVLTLDADDLIHSRFLSVGVAALENNAEFGVVVTPAGYFQDGTVISSIDRNPKFSDYLVFSGEAVIAGLLENRFSTATALFRKNTLENFLYDESLDCYEDWSLFMRMCDAGVRFIVTTEIFFFYRRRGNSMVHASRDTRRIQTEYRDVLRTSASAFLKERSRYLAIGLLSPGVGSAHTNGYDVLRRKLANGAFGQMGQYDDQVAFASLKVSRWIESSAPWILRIGLSAARVAWNSYRKLRKQLR